MSAEETNAIARQLEDAFNRKDAAFYEAHPGLATSKAFYQQLWAAFPDMQGTPQETIVQGEWVAQRVMVNGTMQDTFMGMPPSGKHASYEVITMFRIADGKIVEYHAQADVMGMMQQLGIGPTSGRPLG